MDIVEDDLIGDQDISFYSSYSNQMSHSIIKENINNENGLKGSNALIEQVRDIDTHHQEEL